MPRDKLPHDVAEAARSHTAGRGQTRALAQSLVLQCGRTTSPPGPEPRPHSSFMTLLQTPRAPKAARQSGASLAEQAYEFVQREIITLRLRPSEVLNEAELTALSGIGRTPVHQALHRLVHEDMLTIMPRKGIMVRPVSLDDVLAIVDVRLIHEGHRVELAARHAQAHDDEVMEALLVRSKVCVATHDAEGARQSVQRHIEAFRATIFNRI